MQLSCCSCTKALDWPEASRRKQGQQFGEKPRHRQEIANKCTRPRSGQANRCACETRSCAGIHPGKNEHASTEELATTTSPIFRERSEGEGSKAAVTVRQVCRGLTETFQGVAPGRKVRLPGKPQGCVLSQSPRLCAKSMRKTALPQVCLNRDGWHEARK